jgi:hypothetical protein
MTQCCGCCLCCCSGSPSAATTAADISRRFCSLGQQRCQDPCWWPLVALLFLLTVPNCASLCLTVLFAAKSRLLSRRCTQGRSGVTRAESSRLFSTACIEVACMNWPGNVTFITHNVLPVFPACFFVV